MKIRTTLSFLFSYLWICLYVPILQSQNMNTADSLIQRIGNQTKIPQEKLYLHIDKPYYLSGENVWLKGYLIDAFTGEQTQSNFIYVELVNPENEVVIRKKFQRSDSIGFAGSFTLPDALPSAHYMLRAYTHWMRNFDEDFFYRRSLEVKNRWENQILSSIEYNKLPNGKTEALIRLYDTKGKGYSQLPVYYAWTDANSKEENKNMKKSDSEGYIVLDIDKKIIEDPTARLRIWTDDGGYAYSHEFRVPAWGKEFAISFLPEGGNLLVGIPQFIAFKAQSERGVGESVTGYICTSRSDTIASFQSIHDGMGYFELTPQAGEVYTARVQSGFGIEKVVTLPAPQSDGVSLAVTNSPEKGYIYYTVSTAGNAESMLNDSLWLVAHTRGNPIFCRPITAESQTGILALEAFPAGIAHLILFKNNGTPVSERLVFVRQPDSTQWDMKADYKRDTPRSAATLEISLRDKWGQDIQGDFSLAITDRKQVKPDSTADHIVSNLLLTSDLKGYIDKPGRYFAKNDRSTRMLLDLVMLTHGWRRFRTDQPADTSGKQIRYFMERGQTISGRLTNVFGGAAKEGTVTATIPKQRLFNEATVNDDGTFLLEGLNYCDSVEVFIQGRKRKGGKHVEIEVAPETFPPINTTTPYPANPAEFNKRMEAYNREEFLDELYSSDRRLREVVVEAQRRTPKSIQQSGFLGAGDKSYTEEYFREREYIKTAYAALCMLPGIMKQNGNSLSYYGGFLGVVVNGMRVESEDIALLDGIPADNIENIEMLTSTSSIQLARNSFGFRLMTSASTSSNKEAFVLIYLKKEGSWWRINTSLGFCGLESLGYSRYAEFYAPVYAAPEQKEDSAPDRRSTIHWVPRLVQDTDGKYKIDFYSSDSPADYHLIIEGISEQGTPYRYEEDL